MECLYSLWLTDANNILWPRWDDDGDDDDDGDGGGGGGDDDSGVLGSPEFCSRPDRFLLHFGR